MSTFVTQNVDNLHERAGTTHITHLHGELTKSRSVKNENIVFDCFEDIQLGDVASDGGQLRPHIVWFGEAVPQFETAIKKYAVADICIVIGTSMQVYPAASLVSYVPPHCQVYYIDPRPQINHELSRSSNLTIIEEPATTGVAKLVDELLAINY
jgi:NAD-dependent deacetylase